MRPQLPANVQPLHQLTPSATGGGEADRPEAFTYPTLSPADDAVQQGGGPPSPLSPSPGSPSFATDPALRAELLARLGSIREGRRFRQDLLLPYLLIRSYVGDHGKRPWTAGHPWGTPDILVQPKPAAQAQPFADGPPVTSVSDGSLYQVKVRVWNLGLLAAVGTTLSVYAAYTIEAVAGEGFTTWSEPVLVGRTRFDLPDSRSPNCRALVGLEPPWPVGNPNAFVSPNAPWAYLIAVVSCFTDPGAIAQGAPGDWGGSSDRHVAVAGFGA